MVETINPLTVAHKVAVEWFRPKIDLGELAKLYREEQWPSKRLAAHFGRSPITIDQILRRMR